MKEHENTRTGLQRAVDLAYAARAARRILQAAAAGGLHGAAAVAVKETAPFLVKRLLAVLVALIVLPMVIFTALPNIFFGYRSSDTDAIAQMTGQAMTIGGVYMSLDDFEAAQIDSVVTGIVAEYEESGTNIDRIEVSGSMTEKDLLWIIAINSAAYQQDLNAMSADLVRNFCKSSLSYFPSLGLAEDGGDGVVTTLTVKVKHLDPDELMDELGFDKDAKQWAGALYETLEQSDAINKYRTYYETYRPDHSGDGSFSGDVEYGTDYDNQIDISRFVDPSTKNNLDLAAYAVQAWENNWGYVWGTYGNILTPSLFAYKKQQYPDGVGNHADFIESHWLGRRTADCIGLIKGYGWLDTDSMTIGYAANGMPDYGADQMYQACKNAGVQNEDYGPISTLPELPGLMLWKSGHAGVYIGGGYAIGDAEGRRQNRGEWPRLAGLGEAPLHRLSGGKIMAETTYLRAIRLKYGISLLELERHSSLSNQYLSALELGNAKRTERNERLLCCAMEEVISSRERSLDGLRETLLQYQGRLLEAVEADSDEL